MSAEPSRTPHFPHEKGQRHAKGGKAFPFSSLDKRPLTYEMHRIDLWPLVRVAGSLLLMTGLVIGLFAFMVFPHPASAGLSFSTRLLSALLFAGLYGLVVTGGISFLVLIYNSFAGRLKWLLSFQISEKPEKKPGSEE